MSLREITTTRAGVVEALEIAEISEWLDWIRRMLPAGGVELPNEETSVLFAANAVRLVDRIRAFTPHLPTSIKSKIIESAILHQCWNRQRKLRQKTKNLNLHRQKALQLVEATESIQQLDDRHYMVEASDGFSYVVVFPDRENKFSLATAAICNEFANILGLKVSPIAAVSFGSRSGKIKASSLAVRGDPPLGLGLRCEFTSRKKSKICLSSPNSGQRLDLLLFNIFVMNLGHNNYQILKKLNDEGEVMITDHSHCLMKSNWSKFLTSAREDLIAPEFVVCDVKDFSQINRSLRKFEKCDAHAIWDLAFHLPVEWYDEDRILLIRVLEEMTNRPWKLRQMIGRLIAKGYFPRLNMNRPLERLKPVHMIA